MIRLEYISDETEAYLGEGDKGGVAMHPPLNSIRNGEKWQKRDKKRGEMGKKRGKVSSRAENCLFSPVWK